MADDPFRDTEPLSFGEPSNPLPSCTSPLRRPMRPPRGSFPGLSTSTMSSVGADPEAALTAATLTTSPIRSSNTNPQIMMHLQQNMRGRRGSMGMEFPSLRQKPPRASAPSLMDGDMLQGRSSFTGTGDSPVNSSCESLAQQRPRVLLPQLSQIRKDASHQYLSRLVSDLARQAAPQPATNKASASVPARITSLSQLISDDEEEYGRGTARQRGSFAAGAVSQPMLVMMPSSQDTRGSDSVPRRRVTASNFDIEDSRTGPSRPWKAASRRKGGRDWGMEGTHLDLQMVNIAKPRPKYVAEVGVRVCKIAHADMVDHRGTVRLKSTH